MNHRISAAWKPLAAVGVALVLAGCGGKTGATTPGAAGADTDTLATVGTATITRADLNKFLEATNGEQYLPRLIDTELIFQAGKEAGITISDAEIAAELEKQKKLSPQLSDALAKNPVLAEVINTQIKRNLVVQRLLTKDVKATDAQVQQFFNTYKSYYQEPAKIKLGRLLTSTKARADAMSRALKDKTKTFAQLVAEQQKLPDQISAASASGEEGFVPVDVLESRIPPSDLPKVQQLPKGGSTEPLIFPIGQGGPIYVIYHITDRQDAPAVDFAKLKPELETDYKMAQVAQDENKKNPGNPAFDVTLKETSKALRSQAQQQNPMAPAPAPSMRDILTYILGPLQQNTLTALRTKGTVQVNSPLYADLGKEYKPVPTPAPAAADANSASANGVTANVAPAANAAIAPASNAAPAPAANAAVAPAANAASAPATNAAPAAP